MNRHLRTSSRIALTLAMSIGIAYAAPMQPASNVIEIFTDHAHPVATDTEDVVKVYLLDEVERFNADMARGVLYASQDDAREKIKQRMQNLGSEAIKQRLTGSMVGLVLTAKYDIKKIPAVVFGGGRYVAYGVGAVSVAKEYYTHVNAH